MSVFTIEHRGAEFSESERAALAQADVITGVDMQTEEEFTVFGTPPLESTVSMKRPAAMQIVQVRIQGKRGLDELVELVQAVRGAR
jgi:hypothetical protein